ncbi:MAG TPA: carboxypeptidase-like regulatory domain-containing protein, partial [Vicinamibacterales bacterium]|nr:carboxypeptidase-like regulatory domain-containing protein [Vicinamibacterales bacterium]
MLSVLVLVLLSSSAPAECCRVEGIVRSEAGVIVADATVTLSATDLKAPLTTTTSADGRYQFDNVKPGVWAEVRVLVHGRPVAESVTLVTQPVETLNLTIYSASVTPTSVEDLRPMGGESGELRGVVRAADGTPLAGARVGIQSVGIDTTTDSTGRYSFGPVRAPIAVGVTASANGFASASREVSVARGSVDGDFSLKAVTNDAEPLGLLETPRDRESLTLRASELTALPALAPFDVFRALDLLPAASVSDSSELVLNGLPAGNTLVTMDQIPWFPARRLAGQIGTPLNTAFIQEAGVADAPLGSASGGTLGGVLGLNGRRPRQDRAGGTAELDFFGVSGSVSAPLAHLGSVSFGAR